MRLNGPFLENVFGGYFFEVWGNFAPDYRTSYIYCFSSKGKIGCLDVIVTFITASCVVFVNEAAVLNEPEVILFNCSGFDA